MSMSVVQDELITLREAIESLPKVRGKPVAVQTVRNWCLRGIRGVKLEYRRLGGRLLTSRRALAVFHEALRGDDHD